MVLFHHHIHLASYKKYMPYNTHTIHSRITLFLFIAHTMTTITRHVPVAQLDRVSGFEPDGRGFESLRARL